MTRGPIIALLACVTLGAFQKPQRYEEDLLSTLPIRTKQWEQMKEYTAKLQSNPRLGATFQAKIGYPPPGLDDTPTLRLEKTGEDDIATYHRLYVKISPDLETYGLYLVPKGLKGKAPLVISLHGGAGYPELATFRGGANYHDMVRGAVERGYVVFAPHHIFHNGKDKDNGSPIPTDVRAQLDTPLKAKGTSLMAVEVAKITKALDLLVKRPEVDANRIAMIGLSWGGFYTLYTTALDPRIKVAVASCSYQADLDPAAKPEFGKPNDISTRDLVKLIAPRPLQVQYGDGDKGYPAAKVTEGLQGSEKPYQFLNATDKYRVETFHGVHEFRGDIAWAFLAQHL